MHPLGGGEDGVPRLLARVAPEAPLAGPPQQVHRQSPDPLRRPSDRRHRPATAAWRRRARLARVDHLPQPQHPPVARPRASSSGSASCSSPTTRSRRPSSNASSAARSSRFPCRGGIVAELGGAFQCGRGHPDPPRRWARVRQLPPARPPRPRRARRWTPPDARRDGRAGQPAPSARAAWAAWRSGKLAAWWIAERTSGWPERTLARPPRPAGLDRRRQRLHVHRGVVRRPGARRRPAPRPEPRRGRPPPPASSRRVTAGSSDTRAANARSSRAVSGSHSGSTALPAGRIPTPPATRPGRGGCPPPRRAPAHAPAGKGGSVRRQQRGCRRLVQALRRSSGSPASSKASR